MKSKINIDFSKIVIPRLKY